MLRVWGKLWKNSRIVHQWTANNDERNLDEETRFDSCVEEILYHLDLPKPIWLEQNFRDMKRFGKTEFREEHFVEHFPYAMLELDVIETDEDEE